MVWVAFGFHVKVNTAFPSSRVNGLTYQGLLEKNLLPIAEAIEGLFWMFQQDNGSIYMANST